MCKPTAREFYRCVLRPARPQRSTISARVFLPTGESVTPRDSRLSSKRELVKRSRRNYLAVSIIMSMLVIRAEHIYVVQCELRYTPMDLWRDCVYKVALVIDY